MEAAIRGALEKAGIPGAQARRRIYDSARGALDRSLERQGIADPGQIAEHRRRLELLIAGIEAEWTPPGEDDAIAPVDHPAPSPAASAAVPPPVEPAPQGPRPGAARGAADPSWSDPTWSEPAWPEAGPRERAAGTAAPAVDPHAAAPRAAPAVDPQARPQRPAAAPGGEARLDFAPDAGRAAPAAPVAAGPGLTAERPPHIAAPADRPAKAARPAKALKPSGGRREKRPRGAFAAMFSAAVMASFLGIGIWWVMDSGLLMTAAERDTGVPNPPPSLSRDDYEGGPQALNPGAGFSGDWTTVYTPGRDGAPQPRGDATAEVIEQTEGDVLRIVSLSGGDSGEVLVPLGAEVMQALAGRKSVLALTVRATASDPTQIYVKCAFSVLGDCGRHRFDVTYDATDILFDLDYDRALAPNEGGNLVINSDISGGGKGIDLLAVRIRPAG